MEHDPAKPYPIETMSENDLTKDQRRGVVWMVVTYVIIALIIAGAVVGVAYFWKGIAAVTFFFG